jgi:hypothetical protein
MFSCVYRVSAPSRLSLQIEQSNLSTTAKIKCQGNLAWLIDRLNLNGRRKHAGYNFLCQFGAIGQMTKQRTRLVLNFVKFFFHREIIYRIVTSINLVCKCKLACAIGLAVDFNIIGHTAYISAEISLWA